MISSSRADSTIDFGCIRQVQAQNMMCVQDIPLQKVLKAQSEAVEQIKDTLSTPGS